MTSASRPATGPSATRPIRTVRDGIRFPEGPRWRGDRLWFSDIHSHRVMAIGVDGAVLATIDIGDRPSGLGWLADGTLLISSMLDRRILAVKDEKTRILADISRFSRTFLNDMVVDRRGNTYVGGRNGGPTGTATDVVILVRADGSSEIAAEEMVSPNGSIVTPDGQHLIVAETAIGQLTRFAIRDDGTLTDREILAVRPGHMIDGICLDAHGNIWCGGGSSAYLIAPGGEVLDEVMTPGRITLAVALGGPEGRTLYLATTGPALHDSIMKVGLNRALDAGAHSDGRIEAVEVETGGVEAP